MSLSLLAVLNSEKWGDTLRIVHIYSHNLQVFEDALADTGCKINGSRNLEYLSKSLANFNVRDVMGLIVFKQNITRKCLKLMQQFDDLFVFNPRPIILICDNATELVNSGKVSIRNAPLFVIDSIEGTISDIDIQRAFSTMICLSTEIYDLSVVENKAQNIAVVDKQAAQGLIVDELLATLEELEGFKIYEDKRTGLQQHTQSAQA